MKILVACDNNMGIGNNGELLCHLKSDLKRFKSLTVNNIVIYGRKTLATFPGGRPLPNRHNIILSHSKEFVVPGASVAHDFDGLIAQVNFLKREYNLTEDNVFVIGGASVYEQLLPYTSEILLTSIDKHFPADSYFPDINKDKRWRIESSSPVQTDGDIKFRYLRYVRETKLEIRPIKVSDAGQIRKLGLLDKALTTAQIKNLIRGWYSYNPTDKLYLIYRDGITYGMGKLTYPLLTGDFAVFSTSPLDICANPANRKQIQEYLLKTHDDIYRLDISTSVTDDITTKSPLSACANNHKAISPHTPTEDGKETPSNTFSAWTEPYVTVTGRESGRRHPAMMLPVLRPELYDFYAAFIPFPPYGYIVMKSRPQSPELELVSFWRPDDLLADRELRDLAQMLKLTLPEGFPVEVAADAEVTYSRGAKDELQDRVREIKQYLAGSIATPAAGKYNLQGSSFQKQVWQQIARIPYGQVSSYSEIAAKIIPQNKSPHRYARAVGRACKANPLPIFIPCHRVIGSDHNLTGFAGGIDIKNHLLNLELQNAAKFYKNKP